MGYWVRIGSSQSTSWTYTFSEGRSTEDSNTRDSSWSRSVGTSIEQSLTFGYSTEVGASSSALLPGQASSSTTHNFESTTTVGMSTEESRSASTSVTRALTHDISATMSPTEDRPGTMWQYRVRVQDSCGISNIRTIDLAWVRHGVGSGGPCCAPNHWVDPNFAHGPCQAGSNCACSAAVCNGTAANTSPQTLEGNCPGYCTAGLTAAAIHQRCSGVASHGTGCTMCPFCITGQVPATSDEETLE